MIKFLFPKLSTPLLRWPIVVLLTLVLTGCGSERVETANSNEGEPPAGTPILGQPIETSQPIETAKADQENLENSANPIDPQADDLVEMAEVPATNSTAVAVKALPPEKLDSGHTVLDFNFLASFEYDIPEDPIDTSQVQRVVQSDQIPELVKAFDKKPVSITGFMLPLKVQEGLVTEMLIMRDQSMCCFGTVPKINEWVSVKMVEHGVKPVMDEPVTLLGTLRVGEVLENGYLVGIYELDGERMVDATPM